MAGAKSPRKKGMAAVIRHKPAPAGHKKVPSGPVVASIEIEAETEQEFRDKFFTWKGELHLSGYLDNRGGA